MKIGTVTFYGIEENYGSILQCFALPRFLNLMGHQAFFIKNRFDVPVVKFSFIKRLEMRIVPWLLHPIRSYDKRVSAKVMGEKRRLREIQAKEHPRGFETFMAEWIPSTENVCNQNELILNPPMADAYVCGSDQRWGGTNPTMYLKFAPKGTKKLSYAASFGGLKPEKKTVEYIKNAISDFNLVTIREHDGVDLCKQLLGRTDAELVPDPTILLKAEEYRKISKSLRTEWKIDRPYIFLYLLGNTMKVNVDDIMKFANKYHLDVKYVAINEWLYLLDNAAYVITNSFHGTVFSLLFHKKFITIPLTQTYKRMNSRIETLLDKINLMSHIYSNQFETVFKDVDFSAFDNYQLCEVDRVKKLFANTLGK